MSAEELGEAVRWPDDPTAEVAGTSIQKFGIKMKLTCARYINGINNGLLCNSHYGTLQFLHAMASTPEEPTVETQQKVLEWAGFLYGVVTGDIDIEQNYCRYFEKETTKISSYLNPENFLGCRTKKPWTLRTLFSFKCKNALSSENCTEFLDSRAARLKALGALLHVVQDSYAEGHTERGDCSRAQGSSFRISRVACTPIGQFHSYGLQDPDKHKRADAPPVWDETCQESAQIDDPVLASAKVLWHVQHHSGREAFDNYLKNSVFLISQTASDKTGAGACFSE